MNKVRYLTARISRHLKRTDHFRPIADITASAWYLRQMWSTLLLFGLFAAQSAATNGDSKPPPLYLPPNYDPIPGPYVVFPSSDGTLPDDQLESIERAVKGWSGKHLSAFLLCRRSAPINKTTYDAISAVSRALKSEGAKIVVEGTKEICSTLSATPAPDKLRIEIWGVSPAD